MKRGFLTLALVAGLVLGLAPNAVAAPRYGEKFTGAHGYIVWVRGDAHASRVKCSWYTGGTRWTLNWYVSPYDYGWTTSDAGKWGDHRPQNLSCIYTRV
jgi:hypothetical protein